MGELRGNVKRAIRCPHANYVVQKFVELLPARDSTFIAQELLGAGAQATRHPFGCRVICRFLEHSGSLSGTGEEQGTISQLLAEILLQASDLCRHAYGHHVMEHFLEHGHAEHKRTIVNALLQDFQRNVAHRQASYVIEKALEFAAPEDVQRLESALLALGPAGAATLVQLAENQFGCHIVMTLIRQPNSRAAQQARFALQTAAPHLRGTKFGAKVVQELEQLAA